MIRRLPRSGSVVIVTVTLLAGAALSAALFAFVHGLENRSLEARLGRLAADRVEVLSNRMLRSMEALHSIAALHNVRGEQISREEFRTFCAASLARQTELFALAWTPRVPKADREAYEQAARRAGWPNFQFTEMDRDERGVRAGEREEHFPVYYIEPPVRNGEAIGYDLASSAVRAGTLALARDTGEIAATPPLRLVQAGGGELGIIVYLPVYHGQPTDVAGRRAALRGFASAVFRVDDLIGSAVGRYSEEGFGIRVLDDADDARALYGRPAEGEFSDVMGNAQLELAGLRWRLELAPAQAMVAAAHGQSRTILMTGLALTFLLGGYLYSALRRTEEVEQRVVERTARLAAEVRERQRAEEAARLAEARYRGIFEHAVEGIFQTTPDGHYISANSALARIYGYESPAQLIRDLADIAHCLYVDAQRRAEFIQQVQRNGSVSGFESEVYRLDGRVIWISENARAVRDADGAVAYYEGTVVDVTARRQAEEQRRRQQEELERRVRERTHELALYNQALKAEVAVRKSAEARAAAASAAKSRFLANMSHEIRTPMNAILGYAQILHRDESLREAQHDAMATILASGNHLMALIEDILDLSKIEAGHVQLNEVEFDLARQAEEIGSMFRQRCTHKGLTLIVERPSAVAVRVVGDEGKLRQVLINLVANAVKFTERGHVRLKVEREPDGLVYLEVSDSGPGIGLEAEAVVFEPFQQGAAGLIEGGTGLGLAISRQYVELMGGRLRLSSAPGRGAKFFFSLPMGAAGSAGDVGGEAEPLPHPRVCARGVRALVVDDVRANRDVLVRILTDAGCEVEAAGTGEEALALIAGRSVHVAFVDIRMPGIDGLEAARRLIEGGGTRPVRLVATTASAFGDEHRRFLAAGFDEVMAKPIRVDRVHRSLALLPGVRAETANAQAETPALHALAAVKIPADVAAKLATAAELCNVTDLKACIAELEAAAVAEHDRAPAPLIRELKRRVKAFDLRGVRELLDRHAEGDAPLAAGTGAP
jgi:PAS domain S-box-containing protein